jgi:hypothetical protein
VSLGSTWPRQKTHLVKRAITCVLFVSALFWAIGSATDRVFLDSGPNSDGFDRKFASGPRYLLNAQAKNHRVAKTTTGTRLSQQFQLEIEVADGDYLVWALDQQTGKWQVLAYPPGFDASKLAGSSIVYDDRFATLASRDGIPLLLFDPQLLEDGGTLWAVSGSYLQYSLHDWLGWTDTGWEATGPPAGADDGMSQMIQAFLNEQMTPLGIYDAKVLLHPATGQQIIYELDNRRYVFASAILPTTQAVLKQLTLMVVLSSPGEIETVTFLVPTPGSLRSAGTYRGYFYRQASDLMVSLGILLRKVSYGGFQVLGESRWLALQGQDTDSVNAILDLLVRDNLATEDDLTAFNSFSQDDQVTAAPGVDPNASTGEPDCPSEDLDWRETRNDYFAVVYSSSSFGWSESFFTLFDQALQEDFERFALLFGEQPPLPITIRVYPNNTFYRCLNALAPEITAGGFSSRIGVREISLLADRVILGQEEGRVRTLNALRHEMAILFLEQLTRGKAPAGLKTAVGVYAEEPLDWTTAASISPSIFQEPRVGWSVLWEDPNAAQNKVLALRAVSTVAYLVDAFGWPAFRAFLRDIATQQGYLQALTGAYDATFLEMQANWQRYYPAFFEERWQANVFYGFDFSKHEQLLAAGAYVAADEALRKDLDFLQSLNDSENVARAERLLDQARLGQEAAVIAGNARRALLQREYQLAIDLADQAEQIYQELGDSRHLDELSAYRSWSQEVIQLRQHLAQLDVEVLAGAASETVDQFLETATRLGELGDIESVDRAEETIEAIEHRRQKAAADRGKAGFLVLGGLLLVRIVLLVRKTPRESKLI